MKKLILTVTISLTFFTIKAQVSDTTKYLIDTFQSQKQVFIGKPLSFLLKRNKIKIGFFNDAPIINSNLDSITLSEIRLEFFSLESMPTRLLNSKPMPSLTIKFSSPVKVSKKIFMEGEILDMYANWTRQKANFWGKYIVADIIVDKY